MLIKCPECDSEVSDSATSCPKCGFPFSYQGETRQEVARPVVKTRPTPVFLAISLVALFIGLFSPRLLIFLPLLAAAALAILSLVRGERGRWAAVLVFPACLGLLVLAASPSSGSFAEGEVTYQVTGSATEASLTYQNGDGGTSQEKVSLPWSLTVKAPASNFLYISAQNEGDYGDITCTISVDGKVIKTSTSSGSYTIASCSA